MSNNNNKDAHDEAHTAELHVEQAKTNQFLKAQEDYEKHGYEEKRDFVNQLVGRIRMAQGISKLTTVVSLADLALIKKNKLYQSLAGSAMQVQGEKVPTVSTWEGFCNSMGMSKSKVDEDIKNLETFGEDALKAMNYVGLGYRDLRKLRKLPEKKRTVIVGEVEANLDDKDSIICLIDDLSASHFKEKEALEKEVTSLKAKEETNERLFADKDKKINELDRQLDQAKNKTEDWPKRTFEISKETTLAAFNILQGVDQLHALREAIQFEDFNEEDKEAAMEAMAIVYYDSVSQVLDSSVELMNACEQVFGAYKHQAKPLLEMTHVYGDQASCEK